MVVKLSPKHLFKAPINAECVTPNVFAGKSLKEIAKLKVWEGNRRRTLSALFHIKGQSDRTPQKTNICLSGNVQKVKRIGAGMSAGEILIQGDVGMHLGEEMKGGKIIVAGNTDSWAGCMMKGGTIQIQGNAGDYVGAAYRGSTRGMQGGTIIIHGNVGNEIGYCMRKGLIKVHGNAGQFVGVHMRNGIILVQGNSDGRAGAGMKKGKIILRGYVKSVLPTFTIDEIRPKVKIDGETVEGPFYRFVGDLTEGGNGKLYVSKNKNVHLSFYEKYL
ncbi:MAG: formylmethanofuran dehydrogenase subunit C [Thermoproteota archaeon]|nr:formylmethanofuran dehydrogenase subunit C [Thermoproteota archaeon]